MTMFSLFSQDISVKDIIVNDGNDFCSYDASSIDILLVLESDGAFDFSNKNFDVRVIEPDGSSFDSTLTVSNSIDYDLVGAGTVTISILSTSGVAVPLAGPTFSKNGSSTIRINFEHDGDASLNLINDTKTVEYFVTNIPEPTLASSNTDPSSFTFCSTDPVTINTTNFGGDYKYFWVFSQDPTNVIEGTSSISKNPGELINDEKVSLFVTSGSCTSTVVSVTINIIQPIQDLSLTAAANKTILCENESVVLTVGGVENDDTIAWLVGPSLYTTDNEQFTLNATDFSSSVTVTVIVTPNGSTCSTEKTMFFQEIVFDAGTIETVATEYCSTDTPSDITSA